MTLAERVKVIEQAKRTPGFGSRKLAEMFNCGRTQGVDTVGL